ncbi:MAG TPA: DUF58 domain-containing protein [Gammaproteobacteria bacterium]|nr:DUF58 domain-containing protein [Gammaproteobacteria bacterium]
MSKVVYPDNILISLDSLLALRFRAANNLSKSRKKTSAVIAGNYASPIRGRGMDFSEVRLYQPGDDVRSIDWRVTARTSKAHTKLYTEERERPVLFVVDTGSNMQFGTKVAFKSVIAARLVGSLAWSAMVHGDRVGGIMFSGKDHEEIKPAGSKRGVLKLFRKMLEWNKANLENRNAETAGGYVDVAVRIKRVARPGSVVYVFSDFAQIDQKAERYFSSISAHCELIFVNIYDELEKKAPPPGRYLISDGQRFEKLTVANRKFSHALRKEFEKRDHELKSYCIKNGIRLLSVCTTDDLQQVLRVKLAQG